MQDTPLLSVITVRDYFTTTLKALAPSTTMYTPLSSMISTFPSVNTSLDC